MDPRRARDPRLARGQQQRQTSDSPAPPNFPPQSQPQHAEYNAPGPSAPTPPQPFAAATSQLMTAPSTSTPAAPGAYKARPLFCVVCASNQVRVITAGSS